MPGPSQPKRFIGRPRAARTIPDDILHNEELNKVIDAALPKNYSFEIHKTIHALLSNESKRVALQMPEGLMMYACSIADILKTFANVDVVILGDVTYGACCVDDFTAKAIGCDFLVHYGHSCLVPTDKTSLKTLYVFVNIQFNVDHFVRCIRDNFPRGSNMAFVATIQFVSSLDGARRTLMDDYQIIIPQVKPLSPGEILGCTSPKLPKEANVDMLVYIGDGRFHLESIMISNPSLKFYRYDPYEAKITIEEYALEAMQELRWKAIKEAVQSMNKNEKKRAKWGLITGTLGRQGNADVLASLREKLENNGVTCIDVLLSEIFPTKLEMFHDIDVWVQIACPRLSIDWGYAFAKPLLSPYEANLAVQHRHDSLLYSSGPWKDKPYSMDFYSREKGSERSWSIGYIYIKNQ